MAEASSRPQTKLGNSNSVKAVKEKQDSDADRFYWSATDVARGQDARRSRWHGGQSNIMAPRIPMTLTEFVRSVMNDRQVTRGE